MLKLIKKEGTTGGTLGYDEIQILGARPWALVKPGKQYGTWCKQVVRCLYLVITNGELNSLPGEEIAASLEDYDCFLPGEDEPTPMNMGGMRFFFE